VKKVALLIANEQYMDSALSPLSSPVSDAQAFAQVLHEPSVGDFSVDIHVNANLRDSRIAIDKLYSQVGREDLVMLHLSGHGLRGPNGELFFPVSDTDTQALKATVLTGRFIREMMAESRSKRQVLILDCCFSGSFAKDLIAKTSHPDPAIVTDFQARGRVILMASSAVQYAFEQLEKNSASHSSIFTRSLVRGIETGEADTNGDGLITLRELYDYAYQTVRDVTPNQTPGLAAWDVEGDLVIARVPVKTARIVTLPIELAQAMKNPYPGVRVAVVEELQRLMSSQVPERARESREALHVLSKDEDKRVSAAATDALRADRKSRRAGKRPSHTSRAREVPSAIESDYWGVFSSHDLKEAIRRVAVSVSTDESRLALTGVSFSLKDQKLRLLATDSYRMSFCEIEAEGTAGYSLLPSAELGVVKAFPNEEQVRIIFGDHLVEFESSGRVFAIDAIDDNIERFERFEAIMKEVVAKSSSAVSIHVYRTVLVDAVEKITTSLRQVEPIILKDAPGGLTVATLTKSNKAAGKSTKEMPLEEVYIHANKSGDLPLTALNPDYLLNGLASADGETVRLAISGELKAILIRSDEAPSFSYLLMPIRLP
jgi:hypothetical protein